MPKEHARNAGGAEGGSCPQKDAIEIMRLASKALEQRAAELEIERSTKMQAVRTSSQKKGRLSHKEKGSRHLAGRDADTTELHYSPSARADGSFRIEQRTRTSVGEKHGATSGTEHHHSLSECVRRAKSLPYERRSEQNAKNTSPSKNTAGSEPVLRLEFSLDQVAQQHQMNQSSSSTQRLINIARLREGDGAWVMRSGGVWTYAKLKTRQNGDDTHLVFTVNAKGSTKKFPVTQWASHVRMVAENIDHTGTKIERKEEIKKQTFAFADTSDRCQQRTHPSLTSLPEKCLDTSLSLSSKVSSSSGSTGEIGGDGPLHVPLDTLGLHEKPTRPSEDHEISMYTLGLEEGSDDCSDDSHPPAFKPFSSSSALGGKKKSLRVSCNTPKEGVKTSLQSTNSESCNGKSGVKTSFTPTNSERSFCDSDNVCAEETRIRDTTMSVQRPSIREDNEGQNGRISRRGSWNLHQVIDEVQVGTEKINSDKPKVKVSTHQKKKLMDLDMGKAIPEHHRKIKQESFYSALKSINKRSSVMLPNI